MDAAIASIKDIEVVLEKVLSVTTDTGGCADILFHCSPIGQMDSSAFMSVYRRVLEKVVARTDAWIATPAQVLKLLQEDEK